jgi:hypothetical protein
MIVFGPLLILFAICFFCWLLFTLAVFALPFLVGVMVAIWAFHTGAGALGGIIVGLVAGGATFGLGQLALAFALFGSKRHHIDINLLTYTDKSELFTLDLRGHGQGEWE